MYKKNVILQLCIFLSAVSIKAQNTNLIIGSQIPVVYSAGIEQQFNKHLALNLQGGLLTAPYDKAILDILKAFGTEEVLVNTIGEAFSHGLLFQVTPKFQFGKYYTGLYYSYLSLKAKDAPRDLIENYYGIDIPDRIRTRTTELVLKSNLNNVGLLFGRKFQLKNPKLEIRAELSCAKSFSSNSELSTTNDFVFENLSEAINEELSTYFEECGYIPSLNVFFVYKFDGSH